MIQGRGAWTERGKQNGTIYYTFIPGEPLDGTEPIEMPEDPLGVEDAAQPFWYNRVHRGVLATQRLLRLNGMTDVPLSGVFDQRTHEAAVRFQALYPDQVGAADGLVGPKTSKTLLHPVIISAAIGAQIDPRYLYGFGCKETQMDLGAQGQLNNPDSGWIQRNLAAGTDNKVTDKELDAAYNPVKLAEWAAMRFRVGLDRYKGKGWELRLHCAIAQHNSPVWADEWFKDMAPPNDTIDNYVGQVLLYSSQWQA